MTYTTPLIQAEPKKKIGKRKSSDTDTATVTISEKKNSFFKQNIKNAGRSYSVVLRIIKNIYKDQEFLGVRLDAD
jgi:hypothetical protein